MRLAYVSVCGFRGFSKPLYLEFARGFTVIDGRNGVGKSSIFDAIEFALLGTMDKYGTVSAAGETANNYIWWRGPSSSPTERFVEVGFDIEGDVVPIRRTMLQGPDPAALDRVTAAMISPEYAPEHALRQLCASSIIRDEHIARLSLDLSETDRFKRLRDAIGASDAERWIKRASRLHELAKRRKETAEREVGDATAAVNAAALRIEDLRQSIPDRSVIDESESRLISYARRFIQDAETESFREAVSRHQLIVDSLTRLEDEWPQTANTRSSVDELDQALKQESGKLAAAAGQENELGLAIAAARPSSEVRGTSQTYATLITSGQSLGLQEGHCPLCAAPRTVDEFKEGMDVGRRKVEALDSEALQLAEIEQRHQQLTLQKSTHQAEVVRLQSLKDAMIRRLGDFNTRLSEHGLLADVTLNDISEARQREQTALVQAKQDLAVLDTLRYAQSLDAQKAAQESAVSRRAAAEVKLGMMRRSEARTKAVHDAARRASGEVLNDRLDLVMPLMSEFYRRLRPHPIWEDIDYRLRGDVQRSLSLQVGEDLNPQFIYSSGQRRATGLAFLLSVNMSLSWNHWKSVLLDDPVQHIDDFRSVHLAEVLGQILKTDRQIICAAEDEALTDLIVRHLPVRAEREGKRVTLGVDGNGDLAKLKEITVAPHSSRIFAVEAPDRSAV
jgi:ABC-type transport system involved in cytochrome c biogenesis ATPase subunit